MTESPKGTTSSTLGKGGLILWTCDRCNSSDDPNLVQCGLCPVQGGCNLFTRLESSFVTIIKNETHYRWIFQACLLEKWPVASTAPSLRKVTVHGISGHIVCFGKSNHICKVEKLQALEQLSRKLEFAPYVL